MPGFAAKPGSRQWRYPRDHQLLVELALSPADSTDLLADASRAAAG